MPVTYAGAQLAELRELVGEDDGDPGGVGMVSPSARLSTRVFKPSTCW
ncbi:hypothetical protein AB0D13_32905 [Streptomyces sp. NPDC048430]